MSPTKFLLAPWIIGLLVVGNLASAASEVIARYPIGGEGGYDYIRFDPDGHRLFVSHGTRIEVLNADTGALIGTLAPANGAHGIALAPDCGHGFVTNGLDRSVTMFDLRTLAILKVIKYTGVKPDALEYDSASRRIFVANGDAKAGGDLTVIDAVSGAIVDTLALGGKLEGMAFDGRGRLFVASEDRAVIHVVDLQHLAVVASWPLAPGTEPTGMAIDPERHRLFAACANEKLVVLDSDDGHIVATPSIGEDPDGAVFDPGTRRVYTSSRLGTLSVIHEDEPNSFRVEETVKTAVGARTLTLDPATHRIFLPTGTFVSGSRQLVSGSFEVLVVGSR